MAEPTNVSLTYTIDVLLTILDEELHGFRNAFSEAQKVRRINKGLQALWKALKTTQRAYFMVTSQPTTSGDDDYFPDTDASAEEYTLPNNFAELEFIENLESGQEATEYRYSPLTSERFKAARRTGNNDSNVFLYDIFGPNASGQQSIVFDRPPGAYTLQLWYVRYLPEFTVPKAAAETLAAVLTPYIYDLIAFVAYSLIKSENAEVSQAWEKEWASVLAVSMAASRVRQSAEPQEEPKGLPPGGSGR